MSKAKELRDKFQIDLIELQRNCPHTKTMIGPHMWAPGHSYGKCRWCVECELILEHTPPDGQYELMLQA